MATPTPWEMDEIAAFVNNSSVLVPPDWAMTWQAEIRDSYVGMDVVCESTRVEVYTQQASISAVDVISNVGGQTGLWIGISFLTIMEITEMMYRLIRHQCQLARDRLFK